MDIIENVEGEYDSEEPIQIKNQIYHIARKCCSKNGNICLKVKIKVSEIW